MKTKFLLVLVWLFSITYSTYAQTAQNAESAKHIKADLNTYAYNQTNVKQLANLESDVIFDNVRHIGLSNGTDFYSYYQQLNGYRVEHGKLSVSVKDGYITRIANSFLDNQTDISQPTISQEEANATLKDLFMFQGEEWIPENDSYYTSELLYSLGAYNLELIYLIKAQNPTTQSVDRYYISANWGNVIKKVNTRVDCVITATGETVNSGNQSFKTQFTTEGYILNDCDSGNGSGVHTYDSDFSDTDYVFNEFYNNDTNWQPSEFDPLTSQQALDVHWGSGKSLDYFYDKFGSTPFGGEQIKSLINYQMNDTNAYYASEEEDYTFVFGTYPNAAVTTLDVVGHEITHGMMDYIDVITPGLPDVQGTLSEAYSDIFGVLIEYETTGNIDWILADNFISRRRDMSNPNIFNQPDCYQGLYWLYGNADNGGVHVNDGFINYWFYLLSQTGTTEDINDNGDFFSVNGLGINNAELLMIQTMLGGGLNGDSDFFDFRDAAIATAAELWPNCSSQFQSVVNAFQAVGLGSAYGDEMGLNALFETNIGTCKATVNWPNTGYQEYVLYYKESGSGIVWESFSTSQNSVEITGLTPGVTYEWYIKASCGGEIILTSQEEYFSTQTSCESVSNINVDIIEFSNGLITWLGDPNETYTVTIRELGNQTIVTGGTVIGTSFFFTDMIEGEEHEVTISRSCGCSTNSTAVAYFTPPLCPFIDVAFEVNPTDCGVEFSWDTADTYPLFWLRKSENGEELSALTGIDLVDHENYPNLPSRFTWYHSYDNLIGTDYQIGDEVTIELSTNCTGVDQSATNIIVLGTITFTVPELGEDVIPEPPTNLSVEFGITPEEGFLTAYTLSWDAPDLYTIFRLQVFNYETNSWVFPNVQSNTTSHTISTNSLSECVRFRVFAEKNSASSCFENSTPSPFAVSDEFCRPCETTIIEVGETCSSPDVSINFQYVFADQYQVQIEINDIWQDWNDVTMDVLNGVIDIHNLSGTDQNVRLVTQCEGEVSVSNEVAFIITNQCPFPNNLYFTQTGVNMGIMNWSAPEILTQNFYIVQFRVVGQTDWTEFLVLGTFAEIGNLDFSNNDYEFRVMTNCDECSSGDFSSTLAIESGVYCSIDFDNEFEGDYNFENSEPDIFSNAVTHFTGDLIIPLGASHTLTNAVLVFDESHSLVIIEQGSLTLNNCELTSCTNWQGIKIEDHPNISISGVGELEINGGVIRHAISAITASPVDEFLPQNPEDFTKSEIRISDVDFINNRRSVLLFNTTVLDDGDGTFMNPSYTAFDGCYFSVNDFYDTHFPQGVPGMKFKSHVTLNQTRRFEFKNCSFDNQRTTASNWLQMGNAITSFNGRNKITQCDFKRFNKALYIAVESFQYNGNFISENSIAQCRVGIHNHGECVQHVIWNSIVIGDNTGISALDNSGIEREGIFLDHCGAYEVQENTIKDINQNPATTIGIRIRDVIGDEAIIRKNTYSDVDYGNLSNGDNSNTSSGESNAGLRFLCNKHEGDNQTDILISDFLETGTPVIGAEQGVPTGNPDAPYSDAGNTFSNPPADPNDPKHFNYTGGETSTLVRYYGNSSDNAADFYFTENIAKNVQGIIINNCDTEVPELQINGEYTEAVLDVFRAIEDGEEAHEDKNNKIYLHSVLEDNGDTDGLIEDIDFTWSDGIWNYRNRLLAISPRVSKEVLWSISDKPYKIPHAIAFEVFVANPWILKDKKFMLHLERKSNPMPEYMVTMLHAVARGGRYRDHLVDDISLAHTKEMAAKNKMMHYLVQKNGDYEQAADLLESIDCLDCDLVVIDKALDDKNYTKAQELMDHLEARKKFKDETTINEVDAFGIWYDIKKNLVTNLNGDWNGISPADQLVLEDLAINKFQTIAGMKASMVLNIFFDSDHYIPPVYGKKGIELRSAQLNSESLFGEAKVHVYPNPASSIVNVELDYRNQIKQPNKLVITNAVGQTIDSYAINYALQHVSLDSRKWAEGLYMIQIMKGSEVLKSEKVEITH